MEVYVKLVGAYDRVGAYVLSRVREPILGYIILVRAPLLFFLSLVLPLYI